MRSPGGYFCSLILKVTHHLRAVTPFPTTSTCFSCSCLSSYNLFTFSPLLGADLWCRSVTCGTSHRSSSIKDGVGMLSSCPAGCFCATAPENPPCSCCCPHGCQQDSHQSSQPFHAVTAVPAGLAALCVPSGFVCSCLAVSVLCCHLSVVPGLSVVLGVSQVLCGCNPAMPARRCFSQGFHPQLGMCVEDLPWPVLTFCASFGLWAAAVWGGCCPNSQPPWAVALWALFELFLQFLHWSLAGGQP